MKKQTKIIIAIVAIVVIAGVIGGIIILTQNKEQESRYTTDEIRKVYWWQNEAFVLNGDRYEHHVYQEDSSKFVCIRLACYEKETGNQLSIDKIRDYLSSEYEEDGELRLYISGMYPEIQSYVEWCVENEETVEQYNSDLISVWGDYRREQRAAGHNISSTYNDLTLEQIEKLVKKEADPSYELDLGEIN